MPKVKVEREGIYTEAEVRQTISELDCAQLKAIVSILRLTGARISEVLSLRVKDIVSEKDEDFYTIRFTLLKKRKNTSMLKKERVRKIPKDKFYFPLIQKWWRESVKDVNALFFTFSRQWVWHRVKEANPEGYLHLFRHTFATEMSELLDVFALTELVGWSGITQASNYVKQANAKEKGFQAMKHIHHIKPEELAEDSENESKA